MYKYFFCLIAFFLFLLSCGSSPQTEEDKMRHTIKDAKITSSKAVQYIYKFGLPDEKTAKTIVEVIYNNDGSIKKETFPFDNKILSYGYKTLDKSLRINDIDELDTAFILKSRMVYDYGKNGLITINRTNIDGVILSKMHIEKDLSGRDTSVVVYDKTGSISSKTVTRYDETGLKEQIIFDADDHIKEKLTRIFADKVKREYIRYREDGTGYETFTEHYNDSGQIIEYLNNNINPDKHKHWKRKYTNNLIDEEVEFLRNGEPKTLTKYFYDKAK